MSNVRIALVSPKSNRGDEEIKNVEVALGHIDEAAALGAKIVCFPEGYPGPYSSDVNYSPIPSFIERAKLHDLYVIAGMVETAPEHGENVYHLAQVMVGPDGVIGTHRRVLPNPAQMCHYLMGGKDIAPGDELRVWETPYGRVGMLICSEAWSPELPLTLALKGADIIFAPIGGDVRELHGQWKIVLRARAAENIVYMATCQHMWNVGEESMGMVAGPEGVINESIKSGVLTADVDIERLKWLRGKDQELKFPKPYRSIPGLLRHRRPELYDEITVQRNGLYDFYYFEKGRRPEFGVR